MKPGIWHSTILSHHSNELNDPDYVAMATLVRTEPLDEARVASTYRALVTRHPALSWVFRQRAGQWSHEPPPTTFIPGLVRTPNGFSIGPAEFDFRRGPFLRIDVSHMPHGWQVVLTCDHFVVDGSSLDTLVEEFAGFYTHQCWTSPGPPGSPADLSAWQWARWQKDGDRAADYWRRLPVDYVSPFMPGSDHRALELDRMILPCGSRRLHAAARRLRSTSHNVLLLAFAQTLCALMERSTIVINTPLSGRSLSPYASVISRTTNNVPLVIDTTLPLGDALRALAIDVAHTKRYEYLPFRAVQTAAHAAAFSGDRTPFFTLTEVKDAPLPGAFQRLGGFLADAPTPMSLFVRIRGNELRVSIAFNTTSTDPSLRSALPPAFEATVDRIVRANSS